MANIRTLNEIVSDLLNYFKTSQPDLDTKPGTVARDLFIDAPSQQLANLYQELSQIQSASSIQNSYGDDILMLGSNYVEGKTTATPSTGLALLTFNSIPAPINISKNDLVYSIGGVSFFVLNSIILVPGSSNNYRSTAVKYKKYLDEIGNTDLYAVEVPIQCTVSGIIGNIGKYSLTSTNISGISNVTNIYSFVNGTDDESVNDFKQRLLSVFSGSSTGTTLGYRNTALSQAGVKDALVIEPGDYLMTRDGTVVSKNSDGTFTIISEGTGGKIDIIILGSTTAQYINSYIYRDLSNTNDPTNSLNDVILGQPADLAGKTIMQKRLAASNTGIIPLQPVDSIIEVSGSLSGANFKEKSVDQYGIVSGNYELVKDDGVYAGSPYGFDKFHWISNQISGYSEDIIKSVFNGTDNLSYSDSSVINNVTQYVPILNENSVVSSKDRSIIQLLHYPCTNVTRVINTSTNERYVVSNQNVDGTGTINLTGRIKISGNSLPSSSDILQVDYIWAMDYDKYNDYDSKYLDNPRITSNSDVVDWGYSNCVRNENVALYKSTSNQFYAGNTVHKIDSISSVYVCKKTYGVISNKIISLIGLDEEITDIYSIKLLNSNTEVYNTVAKDGKFTNTRVVISGQIKYNCNIVLPTDVPSSYNSKEVEISYNQLNVFSVNGNNGSFSLNQITIPSDNIQSLGYTDASYTAYVTYTANVSSLLNNSVSNLPISKYGNSFIVNNNYAFENKDFITSSLLVEVIGSEFVINTGLKQVDYIFDVSNIVSVVRSTDGLKFDVTEVRVISGKYYLILSSFHTPVVGNSVLCLFTINDFNKIQPFTYKYNILKDTLTYVKSSGSLLFVNLFDFAPETNVKFEIIDETNLSNKIVFSGIDGVISLDLSHTSNYLNISSTSLNAAISNISQLSRKKIRIYGCNDTNNNGIYNINDYNSTTHILSIKQNFDYLDSNCYYVFGLSDGKLKNITSLNILDNKIYLDATQVALDSNIVILVANKNNIRQTHTKLSVNVSDQINSIGTISVIGNTIYKVEDYIITAKVDGLVQDLSDVINKLSTNYAKSKLIRLLKVEKVNTTTDEQVLNVIYSFNTHNSYLLNASYYMSEITINNSLTKYQFGLYSEDQNINIGDKLRVSFYYMIEDDIESLFFTKNNTLYSTKNFAEIKSIYKTSGFDSESAKLTINSFNQPFGNQRYTVNYNYYAPKQNERISVNYNYNKLIADTTLLIEKKKPRNSDVLVKASEKLLLDVTLYLVLDASSIALNKQDIIIQQVKDKIVSFINPNVLGSIIDSSDITNVAYSVSGVDRVRLTYFNQTAKKGQVLSITAQKNQYFVANNIVIKLESRT